MEPWPLFPDPTAAVSPRLVSQHPHRIEPAEALARLRTGNSRFALGAPRPGGDTDVAPYAVVIGCLDPRIPVEAVFAQDVGAICVVRSAGHVLDQAVVGSVEFAVTDLKVSLVVVLGHDDCRAIAAAVEATRNGHRPAGTRRYLIDQISPAVLDAGPGCSLDQATRSHIRRTVATLRQADNLKGAVTTRRIDVVGAIYRIDSRTVEVL
jgi:carbonic anhydrase